MGSWRVVEMCSSMKPFALPWFECEGDTGEILALSPADDATFEFTPDERYMVVGHVETTGRYDIPRSCASSLAEVETKLRREAGAHVSCTTRGTAYRCIFSASVDLTEKGNYEVALSRLTLWNERTGPSNQSYCVAGDRATLIDEDGILVLERRERAVK